jgi:hypothetical protein
MSQNKKLTNVIGSKTIKSVNQQGEELRVVFTDDTVMTVKMGEETSCVMVRDGKGELLYVD